MLRLVDLLSHARYACAIGKTTWRRACLYLDVPAWGYHVFEMSSV
jgi:hypothetical protein